MQSTRFGRYFLALLLLVFTVPARAAELQIYPLRLSLTASTPISAFRLTNAGIDPARVQLTINEWDQDQDGDKFQPAHDVIANPPLFEVPVKATQTIRIGLNNVTAGPTERAYRAFFQEVPNRADAGGGINTLLRVSVPIFIPPEHAQPAKLSFSVKPGAGKSHMVVLRNEGNIHLQLLKLTGLDAGGQTIFSKAMSLYVLPGHVQHWQSDSDTAWPAHLFLEAETDQGKITGTYRDYASSDP